MESEALSWETRIVEPCHRGTAQAGESELGLFMEYFQSPAQGIAEMDAVKTTMIRGGQIKRWSCMCSVLNFQSSVQSLKPSLGNIHGVGNPALSPQGRWGTEPDS